MMRPGQLILCYTIFMHTLSVLRDYLVWHYSVALSDTLHTWWNYVWFVFHVFSVGDVAKTLFSPWKRLEEKRVSILKSPQDYFANMFVNLIMRIVGFMIRTALLAIALICFLITVLGGLLFVLLWIPLPVLLLHFIISGVRLLI